LKTIEFIFTRAAAEGFKIWRVIITWFQAWKWVDETHNSRKVFESRSFETCIDSFNNIARSDCLTYVW